jgi:hypothetical protein
MKSASLRKLRRAFPMLAAVGVALVLAACGGDDRSPISYAFQGTVSGTNCFAGFPESASVRYDVTIDDQAAGAGVTLLDQAGITWTGSMTRPGGFHGDKQPGPAHVDRRI